MLPGKQKCYWKTVVYGIIDCMTFSERVREHALLIIPASRHMAPLSLVLIQADTALCK